MPYPLRICERHQLGVYRAPAQSCQLGRRVGKHLEQALIICTVPVYRQTGDVGKLVPMNSSWLPTPLLTA
jgi:hypothetical protein